MLSSKDNFDELCRHSMDFIKNQMICMEQEQEGIKNRLQEIDREIKQIEQESEMEECITDSDKHFRPLCEQDTNDKDSITKIEENKTLYKENIEKFKYYESQIKEYQTIHDILEYKSDKKYRREDGNIINLGEKVLEVQERERKRIARDLHDSTVQSLTALIHKIELSIRYIDLDPVRSKLELVTMMNTVKENINELRSIIYDLRPMSMDDLGFIETIQRLFDGVIEKSSVEKVNFNHNTDLSKVESIIKLSLYRVLIEIFNNIIKHAYATEVNVDLNILDSKIILLVHDNGKGFEVKEVVKNESDSQSSHFGISIVRERILLLGGKIQLTSAPGEGTSVEVTIPINCEKEFTNE